MMRVWKLEEETQDFQGTASIGIERIETDLQAGQIRFQLRASAGGGSTSSAESVTTVCVSRKVAARIGEALIDLTGNGHRLGSPVGWGDPRQDDLANDGTP